MNTHDEPIQAMTAENVEQFDVLVFDARDLVVSVVPHRAPSRAAMENYAIGPSRK